MVYTHKRYVKRTITFGLFWTILAVSSVLLVNHMSMQTLQAEYEEWQAEYDSDAMIRSFNLATDNIDRFRIWLKSREFVKSHQSESYTVHLNQFASLTDSEFISILGTDEVDRVQWPHFDCTAHYPIVDVNKDNHFDWRSSKFVTPVRNQAACGSCWAFAAMASLEGVRAIKTGQLEHLSTQQLVDCAVGEYGQSPYPNHGCNGGLPESAFTYMTRVGFLPETAYPYYAKDQNCTLEDENFGKELNDDLIKIKGCHYVPPDNAQLLAASLVQNGPHAVALDASKISFRLYKEGIYYDSECSTERLSHAVTLTGFGMNTSNIIMEDDETKDLRHYWIIKNSWSERWGENGYFRIAQHRDNCGITQAASFPVL